MNSKPSFDNISGKIILHDDLTKEEVDALWDLGVNMDDWDYMILADPDILEEEEVDTLESEYSEAKGGWIQEERKKIRFYPKDWQMERLLTGCCDNVWYKVGFRGEEMAIGVAYHA
jgi:hypothetical protein